MEEHERIELRSDDVQEIIGTPPRWIVAYGTVIICMAVFALVSMSFFIAYPDKVFGRVTITSAIAPARIKVSQNGNISKIFVNNGQDVPKDELLAVMQDAAHFQDVYDLEEEVLPLLRYEKEKFLELEMIENDYELGILQQSYSQFLSDLKNFQKTEEIDADGRSISGIQNQIKNLNNSIVIQKRKRTAAIEQRDLEKRRFSRYQQLYQERTISGEQLENQRKVYLAKKQEVENIKAMISQNSLQISKLATDMEDIRSRSRQLDNDNFINVEKSLNNLKAAIDAWKKQYLLIAPMDGRVSMVEQWAEQAYVNQSTEIMTILPADSLNNKFIKLLIPILGSGKVKSGQRVLIKFDNYPHTDYGKVKGIVTSVAPIPNAKGELQVNITLPQDLTTTEGKTLPFIQEMQGNGEIITEDKTVFTRIFENIIKPFKGNT